MTDREPSGRHGLRAVWHWFASLGHLQIFVLLIAVIGTAVGLLAFGFAMGDNSAEAHMASQQDRIDSLENEVAALEVRLRNGSTEPSQVRNESESAASDTPDVQKSGQQATTTEGFSAIYQAESLTLRGIGCGGPVWMDLDEPRVAVNENADSSTEIMYDTCAEPDMFQGFDISLSTVDSVNAEKCVEALRREPLTEVEYFEPGTIMCVETERGLIAAVEVVDVNDGDVNVEVTAWKGV